MTEVEVRERLSSAEVDEVDALSRAVSAADGVRPFSEHTLLHLRATGGESAGERSVLVRESGRLVGFGHLEPSGQGEPSGELAVLPEARGRGIGSRLLEELATAAGEARLGIWAHGQLPAATRLAEWHGYEPERVLWQLRRPLDETLPEPVLPGGVTIRTFVVGSDEQAWTDVNNRAFASHPEQGGWGVDEIRLRESEPWFDPAGFFLAERGGALVGFHWTKVHREPEALGEVYVVGVDPAAQGGGLATALTLVGLHHLRSSGLDTVLLYVDDSNAAAMRVYEKLGFTRYEADVVFRRH